MIRLRGHWLSEAGFTTGQLLTAELVAGALVLAPPDATGRADLAAAVAALRRVQETIQRLAAAIPEAPEAVYEGTAPPTLEHELRTVLDCAAEDVGDVAAELERASRVTAKELRKEWRGRQERDQLVAEIVRRQLDR